MYQLLMTQALESKERARLCLSYFQDNNETELRKRGYRPLPPSYEGIYKKVYLSHDHVVKVGPNAEREWQVYQRHDSLTKRYLVPTLRLGADVILQPKGKPVAKIGNEDEWGDGWIWKVCRYKWEAVVKAAREHLKQYNVKDAHNGNFALFGDTILCIDFADF